MKQPENKKDVFIEVAIFMTPVIIAMMIINYICYESILSALGVGLFLLGMLSVPVLLVLFTDDNNL